VDRQAHLKASFHFGLQDHQHQHCLQLRVLYIIYLYKEEKSSEQIGTELFQLNFNWITALCAINFFPQLRSNGLTKAKKAEKHPRDKERVHIVVRDTRKQLSLNARVITRLQEPIEYHRHTRLT
jgi:hypothetical protein